MPLSFASKFLYSHFCFLWLAYNLPTTGTFVEDVFFQKKWIYLWLGWVFIAVPGLSLVGVRGVMPMASLDAECRLWDTQASAPVLHRLSFSAAYGIFLDQESDPCFWTGRQIRNHWTTRQVWCPYRLQATSLFSFLLSLTYSSYYRHFCGRCIPIRSDRSAPEALPILFLDKNLSYFEVQFGTL